MDGLFTLDEKFNGRTETRANGVIHIVTGGGGASLVEKPAGQRSGNWAPYTLKYVADRHSFTRVRASIRELHVRQVDELGKVVDEFRITK